MHHAFRHTSGCSSCRLYSIGAHTDSLCPQMDTDTDTGNEMGRCASRCSSSTNCSRRQQRHSGDASCNTDATSGRQLRSVSGITEGPAHCASTVRSLPFLQGRCGPNNQSGTLVRAVSQTHYIAAACVLTMMHVKTLISLVFIRNYVEDNRITHVCFTE